MLELSRWARRVILAAIVISQWPNAASVADEVPQAQTGEVRLASGRVAAYAIHFDRNSFRDSIRVRDALIALTSSGALMRFELPAIRQVRERIGVEEVTCIGRGEGATIVAGLADGRLCRVDPDTLELTLVTKLPSAPAWADWMAATQDKPARQIVVTRETRHAEKNGQRWLEYRSVVHDIASRKNYPIERKISAFLLDRTGRLWLGADRGEWGGWIGRVDLVKGIVDELKPVRNRAPAKPDFWQGVYGFIELRDGQVFAFGGTSHMGLNQCFVTRVDQGEPVPIFFGGSNLKQDVAIGTIGPRLPITHIVEEKEGLLVLSYSDVFRADFKLKRWKKLATLEIDYRWGRPDAVGAYPSVCAVHPPLESGGPYVFGTVADGYVTLEGAKTISKAIPGQLGTSDANLIKNTSEGSFVFEDDDGLPCWRLGAKGWEVATLAPPLESDPEDEDNAAFEKHSLSWYETKVLVGPAGTIHTVSSTGESPGTRTTARRKGGKSERIGRETSSLYPSSSFLTADGTLWNAFEGELRRFENGQWNIVARLAQQADGPGDLAPVSAIGPPWMLLDNYRHNLWKLKHGTKGENPRLSRVDVKDAGIAVEIHDTLPWSDNSLLLATRAGLRLYDLKTGKLTPSALPEPPQPATRLARDGFGRLWLGGNGLWLLDAGATSLEALDRVPSISLCEVYDLERDPHDAEGVIAALGSKGVAFVRAAQKP
jgi:hypothetical protein